MHVPHRLLAVFGGGAAAVLAGFVMPTALSHAEDATDAPYQTCDDAVCLVLDGPNRDNWIYGGFRPFVTDWKGAESYTVQVDGQDAGSYDMRIEDFWNPLWSISEYHYGAFTPNEAASGLDLGDFGDLSGASVYDIGLFGGSVEHLILTGVQVDGHAMNYIVTTVGDFTNTLVYTATGAADYIQRGDADPSMLWDTLGHSGFYQVPDYFVPADPFAHLDFDPGDFEWGDVAAP